MKNCFFLSRLSRLQITGIKAGLIVFIGLSVMPVIALENGKASVSAGYQQGMHVILTGVGTRFSIQDEGGSGVAVVIDGEVLQFDMGPMTVHRLAKIGINPGAVKHLFFSHLHMDHIVELPEFISLNKFFDGTAHVYGPPNTVNVVEGAKGLLSFDIHALKWKYGPKLDIPVTEIDRSGVVLETDGYRVTAVQTPHIQLPGPNSFAYRVDTQYGSVVVSGDTAPSPNVVDLAKGADLLVHEVMPDPSMIPSVIEDALKKLDEATRKKLLRGPDTLADGLREGQPRWNGHSAASEVGKIAQAAGVKKLVLYHRPMFAATAEEFDLATRVWNLPEESIPYTIKTEVLVAVRKYFDGPVVMGDPLMLFRIGK